jgi:UDP-N-acetylmuramoyl-tripeptide--D-alanyl-D-alanine ligase
MKTVSIESIYEKFLTSLGVSIDTRTILSGQIFFALVAERDGHDFVVQALKKGTAYCIVSKSVPGLSVADKEKLLFVPDTMQALIELARHHRMQCAFPVIAIAGSNGKTTTKELLARVLAENYSVVVTQANNNNMLGVCLTLLQMNKDTTTMGVIEMGSNHSGELAPLCEVVMPTHGIVTSIGKEHLEGFGDMSGVIAEESELYNYLVKTKGVCFVPDSLPRQVKSVCGKGAKQIGVARGRIYAGEIRSTVPFLDFDIVHAGKIIRMKTKLSGSVNIKNYIAAYTMGEYFGVPEKSIVRALSGYKSNNFRADVRDWRTSTLVLDCYNANPTSMKLVLEDLIHMQNKKIVLVLGGMREMGSSEKAEHKVLLTLVKKVQAHSVILVGPEFEPFAPAIQKAGWNWHVSAEEARVCMETMKLPKGSLIIAKGSFGNAVWKVFGLDYTHNAH